MFASVNKQYEGVSVRKWYNSPLLIMEYRKMGIAGSEVYEEDIAFEYEALIPAGSEPAVDLDKEIVDAVMVSSILKLPL